MRRWLLAVICFCVSDALCAHILIRVKPEIDLPIAERQRIARLAQESVEREYRIESSVFDHDLAKQFDGVAWWGPLRYHITTNSLGFKDRSRRVVPLATNRRRVLLLGDSFTEGIGLNYEDSYAGRIAADLGREGIEVLNAAVTSYSPAIYYSKTRYLLEMVGLQITDAVVFIDISDAQDEAQYYDVHADGHVTRMRDAQPGRGVDFEIGEDAGPPVLPPSTLAADRHVARTIETPQPSASVHAETVSERPTSAWTSSLKHHSIVFRALDALDEWRSSRTATLSFPQGNPRRALWTIDDRDYEAFGRTGLRLGARHMDALVALLRRHGIPLTVVVYPWPEQLRYDTADSIQVNFWRRWAGSRGVRFIDLFAPFFRESDRSRTIRRFYIAGDVHFNRDGAKVIASEFVAQWNTPRT